MSSARGDVIEIFPVHEDDNAVRIEFFGNTVEAISIIDPLRGVVVQDLKERIAGSRLAVIPGAGHMVMVEAPGAVNREIDGFLALLWEREGHLNG